MRAKTRPGSIFKFVETADDAWAAITQFHANDPIGALAAADPVAAETVADGS